MLKRNKRRYVALELECDNTPGLEVFSDSLWTAISKLYGEYGASKTGLAVIEYNPDKKIAIVRVHANAIWMIRAAIASMTRLTDNPVATHVTRISGTLKSLRTKLQNR